MSHTLQERGILPSILAFCNYFSSSKKTSRRLPAIEPGFDRNQRCKRMSTYEHAHLFLHVILYKTSISFQSIPWDFCQFCLLSTFCLDCLSLDENSYTHLAQSFPVLYRGISHELLLFSRQCDKLEITMRCLSGVFAFIFAITVTIFFFNFFLFCFSKRGVARCLLFKLGKEIVIKTWRKGLYNNYLEGGELEN